ncbi:hypothetical protein ABZ611_33560 [Streptomyces sp. NPDC007861]|uniref:hypothetical protein n=1 Tax=Streptomyces sp. NPDC007861 TaxID=3154893 RepID=UPI0033E00AFE
MADMLACRLCPEPTPDVVVGFEMAETGPGWPVLVHFICAAQAGLHVEREWTTQDAQALHRAWGW